MKKVLFVLALFCALVCLAAEAVRSIELAVVREPRDPLYKKSPEWRERCVRENAAKTGLPYEFIDCDALTRPEELRKYKRIAIFSYPGAFSKEMFDGLQKYVEEGGLYIGDTNFWGIDTNGDFVVDYSILERVLKRRPADHPYKEMIPPTGVWTSGFGDAESVTALIECPLSQGFETLKETPIEPFQFRNASNADATVVLKCTMRRKGELQDKNVLVSIKNVGKGCYVFTPMVDPYLKNAMSKETLDWLTDQE